MTRIDKLQSEVIACERCQRLRAHCRKISKKKRRAYMDWDYWGRPVPSFGDPKARLLIVGLAPGAHGANRTGRMFTGDSSGDFLYSTLYDTGFASQPTAEAKGDGLELTDAYITAPVHCAPPDNKPTREEFDKCRPFLERELDLLRNVQAVVTLGQLGLGSYLAVLHQQEKISKRSLYPFGHGLRYVLPGNLPQLFCSYHPSRQNTQTGRLTREMFHEVFASARRALEGP